MHQSNFVATLTTKAKLHLASNEVMPASKESEALRLMQLCKLAMTSKSPWLKEEEEERLSQFSKNSAFKPWILTPALRAPTARILAFDFWRNNLRTNHAAVLENIYLKDVSNEKKNPAREFLLIFHRRSHPFLTRQQTPLRC